MEPENTPLEEEKSSSKLQTIICRFQPLIFVGVCSVYKILQLQDNDANDAILRSCEAGLKQRRAPTATFGYASREEVGNLGERRG